MPPGESAPALTAAQGGAAEAVSNTAAGKLLLPVRELGGDSPACTQCLRCSEFVPLTTHETRLLTGTGRGVQSRGDCNCHLSVHG